MCGRERRPYWYPTRLRGEWRYRPQSHSLELGNRGEFHQRLEVVSDALEEEMGLLKGSPERPGMVTELAPLTESMTPCAKTLVAAKATMRIADEYCMLIDFVGLVKEGLKRLLKDSNKDGKLRPAPGWGKKIEEMKEEAEDLRC